jgi:pimeloyl-ACP methyl ester carboxylesterase
MDTTAAWAAILPLLSGPAVAVELPGRGRRPADVSTVTVDDCVAAVLEDADAAGFDRFILVSHSLGGITVTETAVRHPDRVAGVAYIASLVPGPEQTAAELMTGGPIEAMPVPDEATARALFSDGASDEEWPALYAAMVPEAPALMNTPISGYPSGIPLTYIEMPLDILVPPALVDQMVAHLGGDVTRRTISDAGHNVVLTHPQLVADILNEVAQSAGPAVA